MRRSGATLAALLAALAFAAPILGPESAAGAPEPLFTLTPSIDDPSNAPPPTGYLDGPCGLAVDSAGRLYVADRYHGAVDVFTAPHSYDARYETQLRGLSGPCALAVDGAGDLYVASYHGAVSRYAPYPSFGPGVAIDPGPVTGVAADPATDDVYLDKRDRVVAYDSTGGPLEEAGEPLAIGAGTLGEGYGAAVSGFEGSGGFASTAGFLYVADAADETVKVYDTAAPAAGPVATIDGSELPGGGFSSLRDSTLSVDDATGELYVVDALGPEHAEQPRAAVWIFDAAGEYEGHLRRAVIDGAPTGLATGDSRLYVTSGNTHEGGLYAYERPLISTGSVLEPTIPPPPLGGEALFPVVGIGGPTAQGGGIRCEGDACQVLPAEPQDPTLTTLLSGPGNPRVRYRRALRDCRPAARAARRRARRARRATRRARRASRGARRLRGRAKKLQRRARHARRAARRCRHANRGPSRRGRASASTVAKPTAGPGGDAAAGAAGPRPVGEGPGSAALGVGEPQPVDAGFAVGAWDAEGQPVSLAGSHPYELELSLGLGQGGAEADLKEARIELPEGLLADPAAVGLCSAAAFAAGECPERSQVGTVEVDSGLGGGQRRSFGLFNVDPAEGYAIELGASPGGTPLLFSGRIGADGRAATLGLSASVAAALRVRGLRLSLWGAPWDASHNGERGECLNSAEPGFPLGSCSVGDPLAEQSRPLAFLTLPARCGTPLAFTARARSWQGTGELGSASESSSPLSDCSGLGFAPRATGVLTTDRASSASGFKFRLGMEDAGLADPRSRAASLPSRVRLELPEGATLNPSMGAGLQGCSPGQYASESPFTPQGAGCPNGSKIGDFEVRSPFYDGLLKGAVYLAAPHDNPYDSLLAVYLVAKAADRGILVKAAGEAVPDPGDGTLTVSFDGLPQLPYSELEVNVRSGQRAPLVSPPGCGAAKTRIELSPAAQGVAALRSSSESDISAGIGGGPCPSGLTPPFHPQVVAGGVNSNVGSYTPYFVHLRRGDGEQEITSYSLKLPEGIVGKLAGVPFCPDAAIARARGRGGFEEAASPSCPEASRVGRTLSGYGVGSALSYAPGRIYLAGPYHGRPLSLVTVNAATVGPFDLGTVVVRSAFSVDPHSGRLEIDSRASDPIPHILDGIPLHLRDVRVYMDRPEFTRNPTGCGASELSSTLTGAGGRLGDPSDDSTAVASEHFQLLNCLTLGFRPRLGMRLRGGTARGDYPALRAVFRARQGDADLRRIAVTMPPSLFLAQNHIRTVCTRARFAAGACPRGSVYGRAVARTPLFDEPLRGPVLLRSSDHQLPDLVADLHSGAVQIVLEGRIGPSKKGGIRAFFDGLPDAPVERFTMWLAGGRRGLLTNSVDICRRPPKASVKALAHNNRGAIFTTRLRGRCHRGKAKRKHRKGKGRGQRQRPRG